MQQKLLLLFISLSFSTLLSAQHFGKIGTNWYYNEHAGGMGPQNSECLHFKSIADTLIDNITTHKIIRSYYKNTGDTVILPPLYVYEQSDTAFLYDFQKSRFQTLYIFNASQGDTLTLDAPEVLQWTSDTTYRLVIDTVELTVVDGITLKKYRTRALDDFQFFNGGYFMDRVGGLDWFFPRAIITPESGGPIRCYADTDLDTSFQPMAACDFVNLLSAEELNANVTVHVFPNPVADQLMIQSDEPVAKIELYDLAGKILRHTEASMLHVKEFSDGIYILVVHLNSGKKLTYRILKQTP